jgi:thioredoxin reductase (NADPH)
MVALTSGELRERAADGVFIFIGGDAETTRLPGGIERDSHGYIRTGRDIEDWRVERRPYPLETSIPGSSQRATSAARP